MLVLTGGSGFIGSILLGYFNKMGVSDIIIVDDMDVSDKWKNLLGKNFKDFFEKDDFIIKLDSIKTIDYIIHLGACTNTLEYDLKYLLDINFLYTKRLCQFAIRRNIPFIYASSAATYGDGFYGYNEEEDDIYKFKPLNPYGFSKNIFDMYIMNSDDKPIKWAALKFFNVYGPNEYHKGRMASMIYQIYKQLCETGIIKLYKSYRKDFKDGEQKRDFIYVFDVVKIIFNMYKSGFENGIYNIGTEKASSFNEMANYIMEFSAINGKIEYIDMPETIKDKYQYYTVAENKKLKQNKLIPSFTPLKEGIKDYVENYLQKNIYF